MRGIWLTVLVGRLYAVDTDIHTYIYIQWPCPFVLTLFCRGCAEKEKASPYLPGPFSLSAYTSRRRPNGSQAPVIPLC